MATKIYRGGAQAIAQVVTAEPQNVDVSNEFALVFSDEYGRAAKVEVTAATTAPADVSTALLLAMSVHPDPLVHQVTPELDDDLLRLTGTVGVPFYLTSETTGGTADLVLVTEVAGSGPTNAATPENYEPTGVPESSDELVIPPGAPAVRYGLAAIPEVASMHVMDGHASEIGRIERGLVLPLKTRCDELTIRGRAPLVAVDVGTATVTPLVVHDGRSSTVGLRCVHLVGAALTGLDIQRGDVGVSSHPSLSPSAVDGDVTIAHGTLQMGGPESVVALGSADVRGADATVEAWAAPATVAMTGRQSLYTQQAGTPASISSRGTLRLNAAGTYAAVRLHSEDAHITTETAAPKTITALTLEGGAIGLIPGSDPFGAITADSVLSPDGK